MSSSRSRCPVRSSARPIVLPSPEKLLASPLLRLENVSAGYEPGKAILSNINLRIDQDDRIALLGQNGNGKSTFAKLISNRLAPLAGSVWGVNKVSVGYFAQHQLDDLNSLATPYDYIVKLMPDATEAQKRTKLGTFGFSGQMADTKCQNLSGGEKARLLLALTAFHKPHILILDEPTNHLDVDSREALIHALADYEGAVILISHDRHLIEASADRLWIVRGGTVTSYDGDMDDYRAELLSTRSVAKPLTEGQLAASDSATSGRAEQRRAAAEKRAELAPLKKAAQAAERLVEKLTSEIGKLDAALADPKLYDDATKAQRVVQDRGQLAKRLMIAEEAWLHAIEAFEQAQSEAA